MAFIGYHMLCQIRVTSTSQVSLNLTTSKRSCHLWPDFGTTVPRHWSSDRVSDQCSSFFVSVFNDHYAYQTMV
ncbi:hypothetical protein C8Q72DRAFT_836454 [Fomitopsis betulina]|nr:hypothetical protein C8Q72DRAFT_836454 [Fomitopsis betulina]